jgi:hypothetical protein
MNSIADRYSACANRLRQLADQVHAAAAAARAGQLEEATLACEPLAVDAELVATQLYDLRCELQPFSPDWSDGDAGGDDDAEDL